MPHLGRMTPLQTHTFVDGRIESESSPSHPPSDPNWPSLPAWLTTADTHAPPLVGSCSGYVERASAPMSRLERATGSVVLIFELSAPISLHTRAGPRRFHEGGFVAGLDDIPTRTDNGLHQSGIELKLSPRAARRLFRRPLSELARDIVPVTELLDGEDRHLPERLHNARDWPSRLALVVDLLTRRMRVPIAAERRVTHALSLLHQNFKVSAAAAAVGLSVTHLERLFTDHFGVPPKVVARLHRFERLVAAMRTHPHLSWSDLAHAFGYADQSHLTREVRRLSGMTPTELRRSHLGVDQTSNDSDDSGVDVGFVQDQSRRSKAL